MSKSCPATNCPEKIPEGIIFCSRHWAMLPPDLKKKLMRTFPIAAVVLQDQERIGKNHTVYLRQAVGCLELKEKA